MRLNHYKKKRVMTNLEKVTERIINRGVYVVAHQGEYFQILEALRETPVLQYIPSYVDAMEIVERLNAPRNKRIAVSTPRFKVTQSKINALADLTNEMSFYNSSISAANNYDKRDILRSRKKETVIKMNKVRHDILIHI